MPYEYKFFIILVNKFRLFYSFFCFICNYFTLIIFFYFTTSSSYNLPQKSTKMKFKIFNNSQRSNQLTDHQIKINELNQDNLSLSEVVKKSSARLCELEDQTYNSNKQLAEKIEEVEMATTLCFIAFASFIPIVPNPPTPIIPIFIYLS